MTMCNPGATPNNDITVPHPNSPVDGSGNPTHYVIINLWGVPSGGPNIYNPARIDFDFRITPSRDMYLQTPLSGANCVDFSTLLDRGGPSNCACTNPPVAECVSTQVNCILSLTNYMHNNNLYLGYTKSWAPCCPSNGNSRYSGLNNCQCDTAQRGNCSTTTFHLKSPILMDLSIDIDFPSLTAGTPKPPVVNKKIPFDRARHTGGGDNEPIEDNSTEINKR